VHWLLEARRPAETYSGMTEAEVEELYEDAFGESD
tara:strand:- start:1085 stop:1189 length:105 start_codon:yes stop_codon:yes gene_type:complete